MTYLQAILIAIVEGLTEFLPISSTAHMIFTGALLGVEENAFVKLYQIAIQFGAILSVVVLYWRKFLDFKSLDFYIKLAIAVIPALILGYLFNDKIEMVFEKPLIIAIVLVLGGVILTFIDSIFTKHSIHTTEEMKPKNALMVGVWQCLAMMPGVSRSAACIIGGMQQKMTRKLAAEFSFFLAVPTMMAATLYSVFLKDWEESGMAYKGYELIVATEDSMIQFFLGNAVAFIVAMLSIKFFIGYVQKHSFRAFGIYRIIAGLLMILWILFL